LPPRCRDGSDVDQAPKGEQWLHLLRQVVYEGLREDKPAAEVRREMPRAK
jgi:hypothetical protein